MVAGGLLYARPFVLPAGHSVKKEQQANDDLCQSSKADRKAFESVVLPDGAHLAAFSFAAALLTITPGLDTALILRTAATEGGRRAMAASLGISLGCLVWAVIVGLGLGQLLSTARTAYDILRWAGAAYLSYLGVGLLKRPRRSWSADETRETGGGSARWFVRGFLTNVLNPKIGVFYVSFLPQFIPVGANIPTSSVLLGALHDALGLAWSATLVLATRPMARMLRRGEVVAWLDRATGGLFILFGMKLASDGAR